MLDRLKSAIGGGAGATPSSPLRKTTEVRLDAVHIDDGHEPALIVMQGDLPGQVFRLRSGRQLVGRRGECDIRVRDRAVSGIHGEIVVAGDLVTIHDLASTNGTVVNGTRIRTPLVLKPGALVKLGNSIFKFVDSPMEVEFTETLHTRGIMDQLTGTFNQSYLLSRLGVLLESTTPERPVSVITFDYDEFKSVNDRYGHAAGDHVLKVSTALIRETCIRQGDLFARMGGEEFVVVLPATPLAKAVAVAEDIRQTMAGRTFEYQAFPIDLSVSLGVCCATLPSENAEAVLARADALLYRSKGEGRNRVSSETDAVPR
jgi:two-component system cell cycle response regulator